MESLPDELASPRALQLQRPPLLSFEFLTLLGVGGVLLFQLVTSVLPAALEDALAPEGRIMIGFGMLMLLPLLLALRRVWARRRPLPPIQLFQDFMELPQNVYATVTRRVRYEELLSFYVGGPPHAMRVLLESRRHIFQFSQSAFVDSNGPELLVRELRRRLHALANGPKIIESMAERQSIAGRALSKRPFFTQLLLGTLVVFAVNQFLLGGFDPPLRAVRWGALSAPLVRDGELFRLLSASFLHAGWVHLGVNGIALWSLGGVMERVLGPYRYLLTYLLSGLGGTLASAAFGAPLSVGASGAIFGLLGGLAVINWRYRTQLPLGIRQPLKWWVFILGLNSFLPLLLPMIDVWAHAGGFVAGLVVTSFLLERRADIRLAPPTGPLVRVLTFAVAAMYAVGLGTAVWSAARSGPEGEAAFARRVASDPSNDPRLLDWVAPYVAYLLTPEDVPLLQRVANNEAAHPANLNELAFRLAIEKDILPEHLAIAETAARRAVQERPINMFEDTLATVLYRRGHLEEAIDIEREVLEASQEEDPTLLDAGTPAFYASQLQRFLWQRMSRTGPIAAEVSVNAVHVRTAPERDRQAIVVEVNDSFPRGFTLYAVVVRGEAPVGLFQLLLGSNAGRRYSFSAPDGMSLEGTHLELALLRAESSLPGDRVRHELWPVHPEVARYP
jgi:membrane associated rhomboid family serine protease